MTTLQLFHPASVDEAISLLAASPMPIDSPTQRRIRTHQSLTTYFEAGRRRPEWVWVVRYDDDPAPLGVVGGFGTPDGRLLLDVFGLPTDPTIARDLVGHVTRAAGPDLDETVLFAPPGSALGDPALAALAAPLEAAGWRLLVERRHYEFEPDPGLGQDVPTQLSLERVSDPEDPRLVACHRQVMRETLDAHDRDLVARLGFDQACRESLHYLVTADPMECLRVATDRAGALVGLVSGRVPANDRGVVLFVGVCRNARGRGYGRELLAWQTRELIAAGATTLIADTDNDNVPMGRAFADVGWPQTETRIDLVRG